MLLRILLRTLCAGALTFCIGFGLAGEGPVSSEDSEQSEELDKSESAAGAAGEEDGYPTMLPSWLKLGAEIRGRAELLTGRELTRGLNDGYYLHRLRVTTDLEPTNWLRFHLQVQDARAPSYADKEGLDGVADPFDLREAYVQLSAGQTGRWELLLGRQELALGDERLVGADNFWCNLGITHDAVRVAYTRGDARFDWFTSAVVEPRRHGLNRPISGERLSGVYATFGGEEGGLHLDPYFLWKSNFAEWHEDGFEGAFDVFTYGVLSAGDLPRGFDYNVEMAFQGGRAGPEPIRAWAGAWELGRTLWDDDLAAHVGVGFSLASGDSDPNNGRRGTFDDLYPAGYNDAGNVDPFAWRNLRDLGVSFEWPLTDRLHLIADNHVYWLANPNDGLYVDGGMYMVRNLNASSSRVGDQLNVGVTYAFNSRFQLYTGYGHLFLGPYMKECGYESGTSAPYVMWRYVF